MLKRAPSPPSFAERVAALREALEVADGRLEHPAVERARTVLAKAGAREALGDATVVALAGATGSGKSSLFNALSGAELSDPGVRRPTTGVAHATVWGPEQDRLLDWLQVPRRHRRTDGETALSGLVLLDLPDHDSTRVQNRLEVDRLVELVDVLVWVLDPQKYADGAVHERYLAPQASHAGTLLVVLNQVDLLEDRAERTCMADLRGLLDREGLAQTQLLAVSARAGTGLNVLRAMLVERVRARRAATERLTADVHSAAQGLDVLCGGDGAADVVKDDRLVTSLVTSLGDAAGVPVVVAAVEGSARRQGIAVTGWPPVRWTRRLRPDPLRRLHVGDAAARTSLPPAGPAQQAAMASAVRRVRESAGAGMGELWRDELRTTAEQSVSALPERLDRAVAGAGIGALRVPLWQRAVGLLQYLLLALALVGALWLLALAAISFLQLDQLVPQVSVGRLPLPTVLLVLGLLAGALLAVLVRPAVRVGARRQGRRARSRLDDAVEQVASEQVVAPLADARTQHDRFCAAVSRAGA